MVAFRYQGEGDFAYLPNHDELLVKDERRILFIVICLSLSVQIFDIVLHLFASVLKRDSSTRQAEIVDDDGGGRTARQIGKLERVHKHIACHGGFTLFGFMVTRLVGSTTLFELSRRTLANCGPAAECPEVFFTMAYVYSAFLGVIALVQKSRRIAATRHNIIILLSAFGVYAYRDIWPLATYTQRPADIAEGDILFVKISILAFIAIILPLFIPRQYVPIDPKRPMSVANPEQTSSIISMVTYTFMDPIIYLGNKVTHVRPDQLPPLCDYDAAAYQIKKGFPHLDAFSGARHTSMFWKLMRVFRVDYSLMAISVVVYSLAGFAAPLGLYQILKYLETDGVGASIRPWVWIVWLLLGPMGQSLSLQWYIFIATRTLARTEIMITELVFEHSLRIRMKAETANVESKSQPSTSGAEIPVNGPMMAPTSTSAATMKKAGKATAKSKTKLPEEDPPKKRSDSNLVGKINNLVTTDLNNITGARDFLLVILYIPLQMSLCLVFLYRLLGWSTFVGFGVMVALLPVPGWITNRIRQVEIQKLKLTDARIQAVSEAMNVIRMVKLFGWEAKMSERLRNKRDQEIKLIWKTKLLNSINGMLGFIFPIITMLASFAVYTLIMKEELTSPKIFSSMAVFSLMRNQLGHILWQSSTIAQGKVSLDRLDEFLNTTEVLDSFMDNSRPKPVHAEAQTTALNQDIGFKDAMFSWSLEDEDSSGRIYRLRIDGEVLFKRNAINLIIGPTGSGKTSMLMALLGEMHFIPSLPDSWFNLPRSGGVAYVAQESWVQNKSIRDNILFGYDYNEERYHAVIWQCALERDLELFDAGDATEVGERGLTLSGGQKARVTLARAIYSSAEIILLDDIFAALDVHTSSWIVEKCFRGHLVKNRTVLLVTHNIAIARPIADFTVSVGIDGTVTSQGMDMSLALTDDPELVFEAEEDKEASKTSEENIDPPNEPTKVSDGKLIIAEEIDEGHVGWKSIKQLLEGLGGNHPVIFFSVCLAALILNEWTLTVQVWFLGYWGAQYETRPASDVNASLYISIYSAFIGIFCIFYAASYLYFIYGSVRASRFIHTKLIDSLFGSTLRPRTLRWLDETPSGRIITRCTQDIRAVDGLLPQCVLWILDIAACMLMKLGAVVVFTPIFLVPGIAIAMIGVWIGNVYIRAQLCVKRETSNARAPLLSHFSAAMHGLVSIRAYGAQDKFKAENLLLINHYTAVSRTFYNLNRWVESRIDALGAVFTAALAWYLVYGPHVGAANTGFSLSMAIEFTTQILYFTRIYNDFEMQANSLERIQNYIDIEHEPKPTVSGKPPASWPSSGDLRVERLSARYSQSGPKVLHDISFHIPSGLRVGVVGRTGSGKSSLTLALLRCILTEGEVYFDGLPTNKINLDALRTSITIIPQTPELLSGTLRENLDPFDENDDALLNDALNAAGLFSLQNEGGEANIQLETKIGSGGGNLSVGQRQIIALARAMVRGSKLLILDEATSAIDYKTDAVIQNTLRAKIGKDVTVITVAHRLQTIMDADKIMVLDNGRIAEFGSPSDLLCHENGMLRALVDGSGDKDALYDLGGVSI